MVKVIIMRRDEDELLIEEKDNLGKALGVDPEEISFVRSDARDFQEHDEHCEVIRPVVVLLPRERPIPSLAMEHGHRHITFGPDGKLYELKAINPVLEPFRR